MTATLDIIIVNWNTRDALAACLRSIEDTRRDGIKLERVVVVDNASTDDSLSIVAGTTLPFYLLQNPSNRGFAAACNQGARNSAADYLLFLNPDTCLKNDSLQDPVNFMNQPENAGFGICGITLQDDHGSPGTCAARFPTPASMWLESTGLSRIFPGVAANRALTDITAKVEKVDQVIGAYFLVRRSIFAQLGGFDERFFVYFEEVDISLRARNAGYTSCILRDVQARHTGCGSSDQVKTSRLFYFWRSRLLFSRKHFAWPQYCGIFLLTFAAEPIIRLLRAAFSASWDAVGMTLGAYFELVRHFSAETQHDY